MENESKKKETARKIIRYTLTPQIMPRIRTLFFSGFSHVAYFMAQIYRGARLLPAGHPYLSPENVGRYGVRHVIIEAGSHLVFRKQNIDQIIIYITMLVGMVILFAQICMLCLAVFVQSANAWSVNLNGPVPSTFANYYLVPDATHDVAFVMLDRVFGIPGLFVDAAGGDTCVAQGIPCFQFNDPISGNPQSTRARTADRTIYTQLGITAGSVTPTTPTSLAFPWPFHLALRDMFEVYNKGILVVAILIVIYFVAAVVAETAQSGTPFGRRFNHVWAPLRLVAALGLLVPLTGTVSGLNSGQFILLHIAKFGSGFATNGWILFNETAISGGGTMLGDTDTLVAEPTAPPINTLAEFFTIVATCKRAYERMYHVRTDRTVADIDAWLVDPSNLAAPAPLSSMGSSFANALTHFNNGDIVIRFGENRGTEFQTNDGAVAPLCGEILLQVTDVDPVGSPGAFYILEAWFNLIETLWIDASDPSVTAGCAYSAGAWNFACIGENIVSRYLPINNDPNAPLPDSAILESIRATYQGYADTVVANGAIDQRASPEWMEQLNLLGWGGAAIWYNRVARLNGSLIGAAYNLPTIRKYPTVMENIRKIKAAGDADTPGQTRHKVYTSAGTPIVLSDEEETQIGKALYFAQKIWRDHYAAQKQGGNIWVDAINAIFGTQGLFDMQKNADLTIHPLAQLTAVGRSIIDTAIRNLGFSAAAGLGGGIINLFGEHMVGRLAMTASGFLSQVAMIGLTLGFVLFYIIPILPFIYFFFAVGEWVKSIFEAMVGVPLWALAHIRIDGNGLPGDAALGGYQLLLEIFIRPIITIFGFLASITIFAAQVQILHEIWPLVVSNATGFDKAAGAGYDINQTGGTRYLRGAIDKFFFTVIYAIIVYMLGMSSFKMIDLVPDHILRWIGASISTFGDRAGDPAQNLVRNSFMGSNMVSQPLGGAISGMKGAASHGSQAIGQLFAKNQG